MNAGKITSILKEDAPVAPPPEFQKKAKIKSLDEYQRLWNEAKENPEKFWQEKAMEYLTWQKPFTKTLDWRPPQVRWFYDGCLNASANCLDRHLKDQGNKTAILFEGEPGDRRRLTYSELAEEVSRCANGLKSLGVKKGDRVMIFLPMIPEAAISMLACARIGAVHSVVFAGFSAEALAERCRDAEAKVIITADGGYRRGNVLRLKDMVDEALRNAPSVEKVLVVERVHQPVSMTNGRDVLWRDAVAKQNNQCMPEVLDSEHPLFILYTSGSTGKPKGVVHSTAGFLLGVTYTFQYVFDYEDKDIFWCTADVGWVTGHSYVVYGPLAAGATVVMYEGAPNHPDPSRFWEIVERYKVSILYTAPTAIRSFMKWGDEHIEKHDISSLRLLGSVGEPINPRAWQWYYEKIGGERCPIVDTWWQTETGCIMISPLPGAISTIPGSATLPFFGIVPEIVDHEGKPVPKNQGGFLVIKNPWPSMARGLYKEPERFVKAYWEQVPGKYFTGDGARQDNNGYYWIMGRIDDVLNVSGHRLSTMEIESALVHHPKVAEAAVVGKPDDLKGEAICCFVTLKGTTPSEELVQELKVTVTKQIGSLARPDQIRFVESLPKTRSGKIMRRFLRDIARGQPLKGDTSTLEDLSALEALSEEEE